MKLKCYGLFFKPDDGKGGGGGGDQNPPTDPPTNPPANPPQTFTQEHVNTVAGKAREEGRTKAQADMLASHGFKDEAEMKKFIEDAKKAKEDQMSEQEKKDLELKAAKEEAEKAKAEKDAALKQAQERLMQAEVMAAATAAGFKSEAVKDVWLVIDRTKITEKDGKFEGVKEAIDEVVKVRPFWMDPARKPNGSGNPPPKGGQQNHQNQPPPNSQNNEQRVRTITKL